jgi:hypothetical protein
MSRLSPEASLVCTEILEELCSHPIARIFLNPVDPEADGVPTYLSIVKQPSDLGTVRRKLVNNEYITISEFERDVNLIWENAILFHGRSSVIAAMATRLNHIFQKKITKVQDHTHELWVNDYLKSQDVLCKLFREQPNALHEFNLSPDMEMLVPERKMARSWLTPEDAAFFASAFTFMDDPGHLSKLIHILTENEPSIDFSEEELQINLAALSQRTLRLLKAWLTELRDAQLRRSTPVIEAPAPPLVS